MNKQTRVLRQRAKSEPGGQPAPAEAVSQDNSASDAQPSGSPSVAGQSPQGTDQDAEEASARSGRARAADASASGVSENQPSESLFKKPHLDEMTVGRTEKKKAPEGWQAPRKSYGDDMRENLSTDGTVRGFGNRSGDQIISEEKEQPSVAGQASEANASPRTGADTDVSAKDKQSVSEETNNPAKPIRRAQIGAGSYEDPLDERHRSKKPKKTGRPGN